MRAFLLAAAVLCAASFGVKRGNPASSTTAAGSRFCSTLGKQTAKPNLKSFLAPANPADEVLLIFKANCANCHGNGKTAGPIRDILDFAGLRADGLVDTLTPEKSVIYDAVAITKRMPKGGTPLAKADTDKILEWITAGAADPTPGIDPPTQTSFVSTVDEESCIAEDAARLDKFDAPFIRYFSLVTTWNAGQKGEFDTVVWSLKKSLRNLSFAVNIKDPQPVDPQGIIQRVDLRDYGFKVSDWEQTLLGRYPYGIAFFDDSYTKVNELFIQNITGSARAWIRADWFVKEANQPPTYFDLLRFPNTLQALEKGLGIDTNLEIAKFNVDRAIFRKSGVALWNRAVDRFDLTYSIFGAQSQTSYWKTYDVVNEIDFRNFFAFPFGPASNRFNFTKRVFQHDAGEMIIGLPGGGQAYYVADAKGNRLDEAVTTVAIDLANVSPFIGTAPLVVRTGVSCHHCHSGGVNPFQDQLRAYANKSSGFNNVEVDGIRELFKPQSKIDANAVSYNTNFKSAMSTVSKNPVVFQSSTEPIWTVSRHYQDYLGIEQVGLELGLKKPEIDSCLDHSVNLARVLGLDPEVPNSRVARDVFESNFGKAVQECDVGNQIKFRVPVVKPPPPKPPPQCNLVIVNNTGYNVNLTLQYPDEAAPRNHTLGKGRSGSATRRGSPIISISAGDYSAPNKFRLVDCRSYSIKLVNGVLTMVGL